MIAEKVFHGLEDGPTTLIFGAIHGNETCGTYASNRVIASFEERRRIVQKGHVIFVPISNPDAYVHRERYIHRNLNRIFRPVRDPQAYEEKLVNILDPIIRRADRLLDLHSITAPGGSFMVIEDERAGSEDLAAHLGPQIVVRGWGALYAQDHPNELNTTAINWADELGKPSVVVECGQHLGSETRMTAHKAIINCLEYYGHLEGPPVEKRVLTTKLVCKAYFREEGDGLLAPYENFAPAPEGTPLIRRGQEIIRAPYDAQILMPSLKCKVGEDWLYLVR